MKIHGFILYGIFPLALLLLGGYLYLNGQFGRLPSVEEHEAYSKLRYYKNGAFQSAKKVIISPDKASGGGKKHNLLRFFSRSPNAPEQELPRFSLIKESFPEKPADFAFYWLGHSSIIFELSGKRLIIDPVFDNAAPIPFAVPRYGAPVIEREQLPKLDYILITHNHYDHLEKSTVTAIKEGHFIVPLGVGAVLRGWGVAPDRITELGWGDRFQTGDLTIQALEGVHFSSRRFSDRNKTLWVSYVLKTKDKNIFWGADGGYGEHFARHGREHGPFDLAALEIDGWNEGWPQSHLFPDEVAQAAVDLKAKQLLPIHWGVFDLAMHPWHESIDSVLKESEGKGYTVLTPIMGQRVESRDVPTVRWWAKGSMMREKINAAGK